MGGKGEWFSGTTIKDTWIKLRRDGSRGWRWGWLEWESSVGNADNCN